MFTFAKTVLATSSRLTNNGDYSSDGNYSTYYDSSEEEDDPEYW
jgi:hypothetical protein